MLDYVIDFTKIIQKKHKKTCVSFYCETLADIICLFVS